MKVIQWICCHDVVRQVFNEVEYVGKCIAETKASYHFVSLPTRCQWVVAFMGYPKEKVSFTVYDSSVSGKKEICESSQRA